MNRFLRALPVLLALTPAIVSAQPRPGSIDVGAAFAFTGGYDAGSAAANETRNPSLGSTPLPLFQTDSRVLAVPGVDLRAGVYLSPRLLVEATFGYSRPTLRTKVSADFEGAPDVTAGTNVSSFVFGGGVEYRLAERAWTPFVAGGAGQVREVPDGGDVLTSTEVHAGGGVRHALTHGRHPFSLRAEGLASYRSRGGGFDAKHHVLPALTAGLDWRF